MKNHSLKMYRRIPKKINYFSTTLVVPKLLVSIFYFVDQPTYVSRILAESRRVRAFIISR